MIHASRFLAGALPALLSMTALLASCSDEGPAGSNINPTSGSTGATTTSAGPVTATSGGASATSTTGSACLAGQVLCSGVCATVASDASNCGSCGVSCGTNEVCSGGVCSSTCGAGLTPCGQGCVDSMSDATNCGGCGMSCALGETCSGGVCLSGTTTGDVVTTATATTGMVMSATSSGTTGGAGGAGGVTSTTDGSTVTSTTGTVDDGDCMTPPPAPPLIGWASEGGGTQGGGEATPMVVTSASEFSNAVSGNDARVSHLNGDITGDFGVGSNKTIIGVCGAVLNGSLHISNQQNVIVRNLKIVGYNCDDSPQECGAGEDAVHVQTSHHLWFDHLDVSDGSDGNLDMTHGSDYITISWTKFWYSTRRSDPEQGPSGHRFSNLIGASDTDAGEYRITFHHNWWAENIDQRMPRSRFGDIHVFNNLFTPSGNSYCTNAGISTHLLVENNIYRGVNNPLSPDGNGDMLARGNVFDNVTGNQSDNGGQGFDPPYDYTLDSTDGLDTVLQAEVGPHD